MKCNCYKCEHLGRDNYIWHCKLTGKDILPSEAKLFCVNFDKKKEKK